MVALESSADVQSTWSASGGRDDYGGFAHVDALDVLKVCLRRWYVVLPVILLSLGAGLGLALQQKPTYTASGSYALVYYSSDAIKEGERDPRGLNPLAAEGAVLLGETLAADFMSGASQKAFGGVGNSGTAPREPTEDTSYSVTLPEGSQSYLVQTWGKDPESLRAVVDSVLGAAPARAAQIQDRAGAPKQSQYTTFVTGQTKVTKLPPTSRLKLIIALLGVGILAGSALSLVADRLLRSRKNRAARVSEKRSESVDKPAPPPETADSGVIMTLPAVGGVAPQPDGSQPEPVGAAQVQLQSQDAASLGGAAATEHAVEVVHAKGAEELSAGQAQEADEVVVDQAEEVPEDLADEVPADQAQEVADEADEVLADQAEEVVLDQADQVVGYEGEEASADQAEEMVVDQADQVVVDEGEEASADQVQAVSADKGDEVPADQAEEVVVDQAEEVVVDQAEEVPADAADEESRVNPVGGEQRHELETKPLLEYIAEPDPDDHWNDESELDNDSWPLLENDRELVAEGAGDHHARDRQPTH